MSTIVRELRHVHTGTADNPSVDTGAPGRDTFGRLDIAVDFRRRPDLNMPAGITEDHHFPILQLVRGYWNPGREPGGGVYLYCAWFPERGRIKIMSNGGGGDPLVTWLDVAQETMEAGAHLEAQVTAKGLEATLWRWNGDTTSWLRWARDGDRRDDPPELWGVASDELDWEIRIGGQSDAPEDWRTLGTAGFEFGNVLVLADDREGFEELTPGDPWWEEEAGEPATPTRPELPHNSGGIKPREVYAAVMDMINTHGNQGGQLSGASTPDLVRYAMEARREVLKAFEQEAS